MGKVKEHYQDSDKQLWDMLECAYYEYQLQHEAYAYEDMYNVNEYPNNVRANTND